MKLMPRAFSFVAFFRHACKHVHQGGWADNEAGCMDHTPALLNSGSCSAYGREQCQAV